MSPKRFGERWEVVGSLDEGGQGWIYEVRDLTGELQERLVLKKLKNRNRLDRFRREIEAHQRLNHPGIARLIDFSLGEPAYLVVPFYDGLTFEDIAPVAPLRALELFWKLCAVVQYAHDQGVFHRDLKPANVVLSRDTDIIVLDFGLCYFQDEDERWTDTMEQVGSRFYMAPELESGRADDVTSAPDLYGLGKILHFLLTKRHLAREDIGGENALVKITGDEQLKYVTERILRKSVVEAPNDRSPAKDLGESAKTIHRLIREHYYPGPEGSRCRFCGEGYYKKASPITLTMHTERRRGDFTWDVLVCSNCNHVEWFKGT